MRVSLKGYPLMYNLNKIPRKYILSIEQLVQFALKFNAFTKGIKYSLAHSISHSVL